MRSFLALLAAPAAFVLAEDNVIVMTKDNADELFKTHAKGILVEFYAPWCGHCKKLEPEYIKAADQMKEEGMEYALAKVDATVESDLGSKYEVQGYPTLKWFVGGEASEYDGGRDAEGIVTWIKSMTGPSVTESEPPADTKFAVVYNGASMPDWFEAVAGKNRKKAGWFFVKGSDNAVTITHKGEDVIKGDGIDSEEKLAEWFSKNTFPLFGILDGESFGTYMSGGGGMIWTLLPMTKDDAAEQVEKVRDDMVKLAKEQQGKYAVTWTNTEEFGSVLENMFGVKTFPKVVVQKKIGSKPQFIYDGEINYDTVADFVKKVEAGEIEAILKSEDIPESNDEPVKVVVGKTLKELVFQAEKDVMLEVYAPWCGHCKRLDPEYIKVGKKIIKEGIDDLVMVAKMDGTQNDSPVESISWTGFPTIVYVKAGSEEVIPYDGGRDAKGIWKWIKKNHSKADAIKEKLSKKDDTPKKDEDAKEEL